MSSNLIPDASTVDTGYIPRPLQFGLHQGLARFSVVLCHRRFGKSVFAINTLIDKALRCKLPMPRYAYIAPTYSQNKRISWDYFKQYTRNIPGVEYNEADLRVDFPHNGARIQLLSAENYVSLKGIYLDFAVLDEYGDMSPATWQEAVRPTLSDRKGGALFIGTVKGMNHFWDLHESVKAEKDPEWFTTLFKASETKIIPQEELDSARKTMSEEQYMSEFECDPHAGLVGAYFSKELAKLEKDKRVMNLPHDLNLQVDTYWDLGMNDATVVWFVQSYRGQHRVIDYYEVSGQSLPETIIELMKKPYKYGSFVLPHDAKVRDYETGMTRVQMFQKQGCRNVRVVPNVGAGKKMESINAARVMLSTCVFDEERCRVGLKALANYQKKWDGKNGVFQNTPLHNWASNGADAFQTFAMGNRGDSRDHEDSRTGQFGGQRPYEAVTEYDYYGS